ncbi:MAG: hypothetical protein AAGD34_00470 [Pseudomonadota bacterium]
MHHLTKRWRYKDLVSAMPNLAVKGKANPYTSMNGNMFSFLDKAGVLCVRLPDANRLAFNKRHGSGPVLQYDAVMKDDVAVPESLAADPAALSSLFKDSIAYAKTLPAKPTKRR